MEIADLESRVKQIVSSMTLEEKVAQLLSVPVEELVDGKKEFSREKARELLRHGIGEITKVAGSGLYLGTREAVKLLNQIQRFLVEETRLGVPAIVHEESLAGLMTPTSTCFPQSIGLASTWDPELIYRVASEIRAQSLLVGARQVLAPVLDICWDPRWGRCEETYGEDPYLAAAIGVAYVRGMQGNLRDGVVATGKHFSGHGFPEGGRNVAPVRIGEREFRETALYPFEAAVKECGLLSVMAAYHEMDGVPCHANKWLLTRVLREEWGFAGIVVSDYGGIRMMASVHRTAGDELEAAVRALEAGVDVELPTVECYKWLVEAVREGVISERKVEEAVERVLRMKAALGLLDNPYVGESAVPEKLDSAEARELALETARKAIVLLKNDGTLPLKAKRIAVVGPLADAPVALLGDYHYLAGVKFEEIIELVTVLEGVKKVAEGAEVLYARGCGVLSLDRSGFCEAIEVAKRAEAVVAVLGERSGGARVEGMEPCSGEGFDRCRLGLPGVQEELLRELVKLGKPVVVVLLSGRPIALPQDLLEKVGALIEAWHPGEEGGTAVAEVLFGLTNPSGHLPVSVPRCVGQVSVHYRRKPSSFNRYIEVDANPLFPFGYGLSYTEFKYSDLRVSPSELRAGDELEVSVIVENVGGLAGDEVVQLYVSRSSASVSRPVKELKGFKRVPLRPGERARVKFKVPLDVLAYYDSEMKFAVERGELRVIVAKHAGDEGLQATVKVPNTIVLPARRKLLGEASAELA